MNIITLTTDWGISDNYSAIFKAHLLKEDAALQTIDITHQVPSNNIKRAAFLLKTAYHYFPPNSVHVVDIGWLHFDNQSKYKTALKQGADAVEELPFLHYLAFQYDNHYFLCENNGLISFLCSKFDVANAVKIPVDERYAHFKTFKAIPYYVKVAADLAKGVPLEKIGAKYDANRIETIPNQPPIVSESEKEDIISFHGQHIDNYGNIVTNLHKTKFDEVAKGRKRFDFYNTTLNKYERQKIVHTYNGGNESLSFLFGHSQYLEIWMKYFPLDKFILGQSANHNQLDLNFMIFFRKGEDG
jgi:S-adenosylmethionine hydrolase